MSQGIGSVSRHTGHEGTCVSDTTAMNIGMLIGVREKRRKTSDMGVTFDGNESGAMLDKPIRGVSKTSNMGVTIDGNESSAMLDKPIGGIVSEVFPCHDPDLASFPSSTIDRCSLQPRVEKESPLQKAYPAPDCSDGHWWRTGGHYGPAFNNFTHTIIYFTPLHILWGCVL
ncbi:uncharacterized protein LACBIDRAFT_324487 [Laccaria bicolor S238N-H82]|uniref:Predicted protein n=1 Tax=Laccaria bicolor (strain S238N-H82 / ATCC MYA-4686) TaxID=486041 RepID=B0D1Z3_LACBS|nr:uncharacterized protein LACBIDRAFT_324487 [Laccaria bicolor S238N-H82]EDR12077.1 predicted protein [Laccaria bicolor S238N-H82]|eukprot:XP_001877974.1 predicted protein [Laccaria bicolor S238N-H82]